VLPDGPKQAELAEAARSLKLSPDRLAELLARGARLQHAHDDLVGFAQMMNPAWEPAAHLLRIAQRLPTGRGAGKRLIVTVPPRHGKSQLCSVYLPAWFLGRDPAAQVISVSYGQDLATSFGRQVRNLIGSEPFAAIFPRAAIAADSRAVDEFRSSAGGTYIARGIGGGVTGYGGDLVIVDDPYRNRADADSELVRASVLEYFRSTLYTRLMPGGSIILILTRWHHDDLVGRLLAESGEQWELERLPAIDPGSGEALWPEWWPLERLRSIEREIGSREWYAQYQGEPTPAIGDYFRTEWFRYYDDPPANLSIYAAADFAYSESSGADYSAIGIFGVDRDRRVFVLDWWRGRGVISHTAEILARLVLAHRPQVIIRENDPGTSAALPVLRERLLARGAYRTFHAVSAAGDKPAKARAIQALFELGRVFFPRRADWRSDLERELAEFPAGRHDDQVDVLSLIGRAIDKFAGTAPAAPVRCLETRNARVADPSSYLGYITTELAVVLSAPTEDDVEVRLHDGTTVWVPKDRVPPPAAPAPVTIGPADKTFDLDTLYKDRTRRDLWHS
jgi:predicted phage terminase large subunit-like protein